MLSHHSSLLLGYLLAISSSHSLRHSPLCQIKLDILHLHLIIQSYPKMYHLCQPNRRYKTRSNQVHLQTFKINNSPSQPIFVHLRSNKIHRIQFQSLRTTKIQTPLIKYSHFCNLLPSCHKMDQFRMVRCNLLHKILPNRPIRF